MTQILIVDDDRISLRLYTRMLAGVGTPITFAEPEKALEWARANDPQLIIVDYQMPQMDGLEFIRRHRADLRKTDIPIIMLTGELEKTVRHEALRSGASAFLTKPVDAMELQTYAQNLVTARKARVASARQADRTRRLFKVASSAGKSSPQRLEDALRAGIELLGLDAGFVFAIGDGEMRVVHGVGATEGLEPATRLPLEATIIRHAIVNRSVLAIDDLQQPPWRDDVARDARSRFLSYIAVPFDVFGKPYGALAFCSLAPREPGFDYADRDFVRLMSALVATTVEAGLQAERLDALAFYDTLTGLPNRNLFNDRLERMLVTARRQKSLFAVLYLDLDGFKAINDGFGHSAGDEVLSTVARRLERAIRESDTVARLGGDEFVVLQAHLGERSGAQVLANRLVRAVQEPFESRLGALPGVGASIGISVYPGDGSTAEQLVANADAALYVAKNGGRGQARFFSSGDFDSDAAVCYDSPVAGPGVLEPSESILS